MNYQNLSKTTSYAKGLKGENKALWFLKKNGYNIIGTRIKTKHGEIDILARKNTEFYIIEVKQREIVNNALEAINQRKLERCINAFFDYSEREKITYEQFYIKAIIVTSNYVKMIDIEEITL